MRFVVILAAVAVAGCVAVSAREEGTVDVVLVPPGVLADLFVSETETEEEE